MMGKASAHENHIGVLGFDGIPAPLQDVDGGIQPALITEVGRYFIGCGARGGAEHYNALAAVGGIKKALFYIEEKLISLSSGADGVGIGTGEAIFFVIGLAAGINPDDFFRGILLHEGMPADVVFTLGIERILLAHDARGRKPCTFYPIQHQTQGENDQPQAYELSECVFHAFSFSMMPP